MATQKNRIIKFKKNGFSLIETLVAMAIFAIIGVAVLSALATSQKATLLTNIRTQAETIARSQIEYLKAHIDTWYDENDPPTYDAYILTIEPNYTVVIEATRMDPLGNGYASDDGLQQIKVIISHNSVEVLSVTDMLVKP